MHEHHNKKLSIFTGFRPSPDLYCNPVNRSVIAEAMVLKLLEKLRTSGNPLNIHVESASLGPSFAAHDPRVQRLAREAGLKLPPRRRRCFDETRDMVDFDLILVMDKFDFEEVPRCLVHGKIHPWQGTEADFGSRS